MATSYMRQQLVNAQLSEAHHLTALFARVLLVAIFLISGVDKLTGFEGTVAYIASKGLPMPEIAAAIAIAVEVGLGLLVLSGWKARAAALVIAIFSIVAGFLFHAYWTDAPAERMADFINFWKNVSIAGGFLMIAAFGPGRYSAGRS